MIDTKSDSSYDFINKSSRNFRLIKIKSKNQIHDSTLKTEKINIKNSIFQDIIIGKDTEITCCYYPIGVSNMLYKRARQIYKKNVRCRKKYIQQQVNLEKNTLAIIYDEE
jgi:hypothetical protein